MFTNRAFRTWPLVVAGALIYGALFMLIVMMADLVFLGFFRPTQGAMLLGLAALAGYIGVAILLRRKEDETTRW